MNNINKENHNRVECDQQLRNNKQIYYIYFNKKITLV